MIDVNKIDLGKLACELILYEGKWIAVSEENKIVSSGSTYGETVDRVKNTEKVILLKVPLLNYSLAPSEI